MDIQTLEVVAVVIMYGRKFLVLSRMNHKTDCRELCGMHT